jgi:hypothetical protein
MITHTAAKSPLALNNRPWFNIATRAAQSKQTAKRHADIFRRSAELKS